MEKEIENCPMLDLLVQPGFCVRENRIVRVNPIAARLPLTVGEDVRPLLRTGEEEYAAFQAGCLYLRLCIGGREYGATVTRVEEDDVFLLDGEDMALQALALAAQELRMPLQGVILAARNLPQPEDDAGREQAARLSRGLHQLMRIVGNMSGAGESRPLSRHEVRDIGSVFQEIFEKAEALVARAGICLTYKGLAESVYGLVDQEQLERAVLNILSNAVKFTPSGGTIDAGLTRRGRMLQLRILDSGSGIAENLLGTLFTRYQREPGIEDSRHGIGLGLVLIRAAAANHGGAVLIDQPGGGGTRVTMTLAIRQDTDNLLRSNMVLVDYSGEFDHALVELSQCLPLEVYEDTL